MCRSRVDVRHFEPIDIACFPPVLRTTCLSISADKLHELVLFRHLLVSTSMQLQPNNIMVDFGNTDKLPSMRSVNDGEVGYDGQDIPGQQFGSNMKLTRAICSLALGLGGLGGAWAMAFEKPDNKKLANSVFALLSASALLLIFVRMLLGRAKNGDFIPQSCWNPVSIAGMAPGTMAWMLFGVNLYKENWSSSIVAEVIFLLGLAMQMLILIVVVMLVWREHHATRSSKRHLGILKRHAIPPLFLVPPVGLGISFNAAMEFHDPYVSMAWGLTLWGSTVTILGMLPSTMFMFDVDEDSLPLIPVLIAPPSLSLGALLALVPLQNPWRPPDAMLEVIEYTLFIGIAYSMLISMFFLKRFWISIFVSPKKMSVYYASTTFPLAAASVAVMHFGAKVDDPNVHIVGLVLMGMSTLVTLGVCVSLPFHLWREQATMQQPQAFAETAQLITNYDPHVPTPYR
eukprot:m.87654 g.87654  ORF g.87654 m.87654 type:complete len:457 (-) comp26104_c0_seq1:58-1428(-)